MCLLICLYGWKKPYFSITTYISLELSGRWVQSYIYWLSLIRWQSFICHLAPRYTVPAPSIYIHLLSWKLCITSCSSLYNNPLCGDINKTDRRPAALFGYLTGMYLHTGHTPIWWTFNGQLLLSGGLDFIHRGIFIIGPSSRDIYNWTSFVG